MHEYFRRSVLSVQSFFNGFDSLAKRPLDASDNVDRPPVFLVGPPRTGSTLVLQMMLGQLRLAYISNIMALLPSAMVKMTRLTRRVASKYDGNIRKSKYGYVPGLFSPNEAGQVLRRWLDRAATQQEQDYVRQTFSWISSLTGCPILIKNATNSIRIESIRSILPESRFVLLRRDPLMTAQSILLVRRRLAGSDMHWWSVRPPGYESVLDKAPLYQVLWQVLALEKLVLKALRTAPNVHLVLEYEEFCRNPRQALQTTKEVLGLEWRENAPAVPESIPASNQTRLSPKEWAELERIYQDVKTEVSLS